MGHGDQPRDGKGRWTKRHGAPVLAGLALAVAVAGGGAGLGVGGVTSGSTGGSAAAPRVQAKGKSNAKARDRDPGPSLLRLQRRGLRVEQRLRSDDDCAAHSYGRVRDFFGDHPCTALFRALFVVRDRSGNAVLLAVAWVDMPDTGQANRFRRLVDGGGTGNVTELSREGGRFRDVRFNGAHYESEQDGETVVNAQAQPVGRSTAADALASTVVRSALS